MGENFLNVTLPCGITELRISDNSLRKQLRNYVKNEILDDGEPMAQFCNPSIENTPFFNVVVLDNPLIIKDILIASKGDCLEVSDLDNIKILSESNLRSNGFILSDTFYPNEFFFSRDGFSFVDISSDRAFVLRHNLNGNQYCTHRISQYDYSLSHGHYFYYGKWNGDTGASARNAAQIDMKLREIKRLEANVSDIQKDALASAEGSLFDEGFYQVYSKHAFEKIEALKNDLSFFHDFGSSMFWGLINDDKREAYVYLNNFLNDNNCTEEQKNMVFSSIGIDAEEMDYYLNEQVV